MKGKTAFTLIELLVVERVKCVRPQSASRRRAEAALWRAAKAEGLAHSTTLREI
jgi:hypothetical protein